jgi:hypothetical protein
MDTATEAGQDWAPPVPEKRRRRLTTKDIETIMQFGLLMPQPQLPDIFGNGADSNEQLAGLLGR